MLNIRFAYWSSFILCAIWLEEWRVEFKQFLVKRKRSIAENTIVMCTINESRKLIFVVNEKSLRKIENITMM